MTLYFILFHLMHDTLISIHATFNHHCHRMWHNFPWTMHTDLNVGIFPKIVFKTQNVERCVWHWVYWLRVLTTVSKQKHCLFACSHSVVAAVFSLACSRWIERDNGTCYQFEKYSSYTQIYSIQKRKNITCFTYQTKSFRTIYLSIYSHGNS